MQPTTDGLLAGGAVGPLVPLGAALRSAPAREMQAGGWPAGLGEDTGLKPFAGGRARTLGAHFSLQPQWAEKLCVRPRAPLGPGTPGVH